MKKTNEINVKKKKQRVGKILVIAVGINEYRESEDRLNNCCTDAEAVFDTFNSKDYFDIAEGSILIISDKKRTEKQDLLDAISKCESYIDEKTNIVFYYSGHGCNIGGTFHFFVSDSRLPSNNLISIDEVTSLLSSFNSGKYKSITVLIDACQQKVSVSKGLGDQSSKFIDEYIDQAKGLGVIYSCKNGECSLDTYNENNISVFTYLLLQALNGHKDAVDANLLTFNKMFEYLQLKSREISRENMHISQHPQLFFQGNDIVYSYIPDEMQVKEDTKISVVPLDEVFMSTMFDLQNTASLLNITEPLGVDNSKCIAPEIPSEDFIRDVCDKLDQNKKLNIYDYTSTLTDALVYHRLILDNLSGDLKTSKRQQIVNNITHLLDALNEIYDKIIDRMY